MNNTQFIYKIWDKRFDFVKNVLRCRKLEPDILMSFRLRNKRKGDV